MERTAPLLLAALLAIGLAACPARDDDDTAADDDDTTDDVPLIDHSGFDDLTVAARPPILVSPERPPSLTPVSIMVNGESGASVAFAFQGPGCGDFVATTATVPAIVGGLAGAQGACDVQVTLVRGDGSVVGLDGRFQVVATDPVLPPLDVLGGVWIDDDPPPPDPNAAAPTPLAVQGPVTFTNGGTVEWSVTWEGDEAPRAVLLAVDGYPGYFMRTLPADASTAAVTVTFPQDVFEQLGAERDDTIQLRLALIGRWDRFKGWLAHVVSGTHVGSGDVQVGASWNTATDVDLHVVDPSGNETYYGNSPSATGGTLDLDSNPGCNIDNVNAENIYWPAGTSPSGEYRAFVRMYDSCEVGEAVGTINITYCGADSPRTEPFSLGATGSEQEWTFTSNCHYSAAGRVRYEDFPVSRSGRAATGTYVPARRVTVQVLQESDGAVVAEGTTDRAGRFRVRFDLEPDADGNHRYRVRVVAAIQSDFLTLSAWKGSSRWAWTTPAPIDADVEPHRTNVDMDVSKDQGAGALNVFDVGVQSNDWVLRHVDDSFGDIQIWWDPDSDRGTGFHPQPRRVMVAGHATDPDEWDDARVAHEFGHAAMALFSQSDSPGNAHYPYERSTPTLAWGEGFAHWFGATSQGTTMFSNTRADGTSRWWFSLEHLPPEVPMGTAGGALDGALSEMVVAGILLDLSDGTGEQRDTVKDRGATTWAIVTFDMNPLSGLYMDRGATGRDLIDFLDAWVRDGRGDVGTDDETGLRGIVRGLHSVTAYDFAPPP